MTEYPSHLEALLDWPLNAKSAVMHPRPESKVADWLAFHSLTREYCLKVISLIDLAKATLKVKSLSPVNLDCSDVWKLCFKAFVARYPQLSLSASQVYKYCPSDFIARPNKYPNAFTYDLGPEHLPFVSIHYQNTPKNCLEMAHEFGHAVQLVASRQNSIGQTIMPPMFRECCAFLSERALLRYTVEYETSLDESLHSVWEEDSQVYLGTNLDELSRALDDEHRTYRYEWNYPIARTVSSLLDQNFCNQGTLFKHGGESNKAAVLIQKELSLIE